MSRLAYLKVKIRSLADESRIIKQLEQKNLLAARKARFFNDEEPNISTNLTKHVCPTGDTAYNRKMYKWRQRALAAKAKVKSLDDQAPKANAIETWAEAIETYHGLRHHRISVVRKVARSSHLAYGFLSGVPYFMMERSCHSKPNWGFNDQPYKHSDSVLAVAIRFSGVTPQDTRQRFEEWYQDATAYFKQVKASAEFNALQAQKESVQEPATAV